MKTLAITDLPKGDGNYRGVSVPKPIYERARAASRGIGHGAIDTSRWGRLTCFDVSLRRRMGPFPSRRESRLATGRPTNAQRRAAGRYPQRECTQ